MVFSNAGVAGNKELMQQQRIKMLKLNEVVIKQIDAFENDALISFIGRVVRKPDGSVEVLVERIDKKPIEKDFVIKKSGGRYIQYMSFEEMQKLPVTTEENKNSKLYGGGAQAK